MEPSTSPTVEARPPSPVSWRSTDLPTLRIPVLVDAEKRLAKGEYARAVSDSYHRVVLDLQKAYGLSLPPQWTHREFLSDFLRDDMGVLTSRVARLYRLYEPVRYGSGSGVEQGELLELLRQIYEEPPLRDLYTRGSNSAAPKGGPTNGSRSAPPGVEGSPSHRS
ncbi:MAG: DUF4129 domain-containing protein [Thermoplasmata archaeon]|nr:DUF4129 domain-containing protein [Thermoplasmata archaeon]